MEQDAGDLPNTADKPSSKITAKTKAAYNAFEELMKPKPRIERDATKRKAHVDHDDQHNRRSGLGVYLKDPASEPEVITFNDDFVLVKDAYPKSSVHFLILPRDPSIYELHPYDALNIPANLDKVRPEVERAIEIAASELRRRFGHVSAADKSRREAIEGDDVPDTLPPGRDWAKDIMAGIHTHPSMNHLHIHIISVDRISPAMKHRKHYNSFNPKYNNFFVPISSFPLSDKDADRRYESHWHEQDMMCWRCGRNFGNKFKQLKEHLESEFVAWQAE